MNAKIQVKDIDYSDWYYISEAIKRLRKIDPAASITGLPTNSLVRLAKDLGIQDPHKVSRASLKYTAVIAMSVGLAHDDLTEAEWLKRTTPVRHTLRRLTPAQFSTALAELFGRRTHD